MAGRILVGCQDGVYVILFEGDVRLTLYTAAERFLDRMFSDVNFKSVMVDLSSTESIDSTSLGLLAKLSILAKRHFDYVPTLVSTRSDITRILLSMGFDDVFHIVEVPLERTSQLGELPELVTTEEDMRERVIEAHRTLMSMNESNRETFQDLVAALETEEAPVMERRRASR